MARGTVLSMLACVASFFERPHHVLSATLLGKRALGAGRLLRDVAWARAHLRVVDVWLSHTKNDPVQRAWLESYDRVLMKFPTPYQT